MKVYANIIVCHRCQKKSIDTTTISIFVNGTPDHPEAIFQEWPCKNLFTVVGDHILLQADECPHFLDHMMIQDNVQMEQKNG